MDYRTSNERSANCVEDYPQRCVATCPELNVASQVRTFDEAEAMIQEAVQLLLEEADEAEIKRRRSIRSNQNRIHAITS